MKIPQLFPLAILGAIAMCSHADAASRPPAVSEAGLANRNDILLFSDFEKDDWWRDWGSRGNPKNCELVEGEGVFGGRGKSLRVTVKSGDHYGTSVSYKFKRQVGAEPDEICFRYYMKLDEDWKHATFGGKMPGFGGTYGRAGWGGRPVNGSNGWSARGLFTHPKGQGSSAIGYYCYHADMRGRYGGEWRFKPKLTHGRWHCIEMYVKLNSLPAGGGRGANDGILRGWIDGQSAYEKTDIRFRDVGTLKIETVWLDVYHGGPAVPPRDIHVWFDNMVIARGPIGVMRLERPKAKPTRAKVVLPKISAEDAAASRNERAAGKLFQMARQAERMGQRSVAQGLYKQVVEKYPGTEVAKKAKEKIK